MGAGGVAVTSGVLILRHLRHLQRDKLVMLKFKGEWGGYLYQIITGLCNDMEPCVRASLCQNHVASLINKNVMSTVPEVLESHLLNPVPELAERLQPLTGGGKLQQSVAAHHKVVLHSSNILKRWKSLKLGVLMLLSCHRHLQSE